MLDILELTIAPIELGLAVVVYAAAPRQLANRALAIMLALEGLGIGGLTNGLDTFVPPDLFVPLFLGPTLFSLWVASAWYLVFIAASLHTPITQPLRTPLGRRCMVALALLAVPAYWLLPDDFFGRFKAVLWVAVLVCLCTLLVTLWAFFASAKGTPQRKRAFAYVIAFSLRDMGLLFIAGKYLAGWQYGGWLLTYSQWISFWLSFLWIPFAIGVAYGTLRGQLFDIDARVQRLLQRATIVVAGALAFFALSEGLEAVVPSASAWVGLAGAALITLSLWPLQRAVGRVTDRFVPDANEPKHVRLRKEEVYLTALAAAQEDGAVGDRERRMLVGLCERLGLTSEEAGRLEAGVHLH